MNKSFVKKCLIGCGCLPQRFVLIFFIVTGLITCYLMRTCLNLALSEMTFPLSPKNKTNSSTCPQDTSHKNKTHSKAEFHWSGAQQNGLISSMFVGYIIAHIPAGVLSDLFGGKHVFGGGILISAICSFLSPALAHLSYWAFIFGRIVLGFAQGVMFPGSSALVAKWVPPNERSITSGFVQSGIMLGNALGLILSGVILHNVEKWDTLFYICGGIGLVWCLCWYLLCYSTPAQHPFISDKERTMIETQIALTSKKKPKNIPWKGIALSKPFIVLNLINFGHAWALFTMVNQMPTYFSKVLKFNIKDSGIMSAMPHLFMTISAIGFGIIADCLINRKITPITFNRKLIAFGANLLPIPFLIGASFAGCDRKLVIGLLVCMMFFKGGSYSSSRANPIDLSPNYAGTLMGIMNGSGAFAGLLGPLLSSTLLTNDGTIEEWRHVFYMAGAVMLLFSIPFLFFASGESQPWNHAAESDEPADNNQSRTRRSSVGTSLDT